MHLYIDNRRALRRGPPFAPGRGTGLAENLCSPLLLPLRSQANTMMHSVAPRGLGAALRGSAVRARPSCALRAAAGDADRATVSLQARPRALKRPGMRAAAAQYIKPRCDRAARAATPGGAARPPDSGAVCHAAAAAPPLHLDTAFATKLGVPMC